MAESSESAEFQLIPLPGARKPELWRYFCFRSLDGKKIAAGWQKTAYCKIDKCKHPAVAYSGNSTNLTRHLSLHHPREHSVVLGQAVRNTQSIANFATPRKLPLSDPKSRKITTCIVKMIVADLRPANVVEGEGFAELMVTIAPEYPLAKAEFYSQQVCDLYAVKSNALKDKLALVEHDIANTTDLWTSVAHHAYMSITGHYVSPEGRLHCILLDCVELPADEHQPPAKRLRGDSLVMNFIKSRIPSSAANNVASTSDSDDLAAVESELSSYIADRPQAALRDDPVVFWKVNGDRWPLLSRVANKLLAVPATSVPSERSFSTAGLIVSRLRASMSPEMVQQIMFLHKSD